MDEKKRGGIERKPANPTRRQVMSDIVERLRGPTAHLVTERAADEIVALCEQLAFAMAHPTEVERALREQVAALTKDLNAETIRADLNDRQCIAYKEQVAALIEERHKSAEQYVNLLNQIDALTKELDTVRRLNLALTKNAMNRPKDCPSCNTWADNVSLRERVDALTKERDDRLSPYLYRELKADLAASQAREAAMRSCITDLSGWSDPVLQDVCNEALALPADDTALKERLKKAQVDVLREAAGEEGGYVWRAELRALADELERSKT